jgi:hypothetical protein
LARFWAFVYDRDPFIFSSTLCAFSDLFCSFSVTAISHGARSQVINLIHSTLWRNGAKGGLDTAFHFYFTFTWLFTGGNHDLTTPACYTIDQPCYSVVYDSRCSRKTSSDLQPRQHCTPTHLHTPPRNLDRHGPHNCGCVAFPRGIQRRIAGVESAAGRPRYENFLEHCTVGTVMKEGGKIPDWILLEEEEEEVLR